MASPTRRSQEALETIQREYGGGNTTGSVPFVEQIVAAANEGSSVPLGQIGAKISREADGSVRYSRTLTPTQKRRALSVTILVFGVLGVGAIIVVAATTHQSAVYFGLIPTGLITSTGIGLTIYYCRKEDLDSPKRQEAERQQLRNKSINLSKIVKKYIDSLEQITDYALLGDDAPRQAYKTLTDLCKKLDAAQQKRDEHLQHITNLANEALAPARARYREAVNVPGLAGGVAMGVNVMSDSPAMRFASTLAAQEAARVRGRAEAFLEVAVEEVNKVAGPARGKVWGVYSRVKQELNRQWMALDLTPPPTYGAPPPYTP